MPRARPRVLALDLESTLVSNAVSQFARPGLNDFLAWALSSFERVVLFTSVPEPHARQVLRTLVEYGEAPPGTEHIEHVAWSGPVKDLCFVRDAAVEEVLLVDDQERYVVPAQRSQWIPIAEWDAPYSGEDRELERVRGVIEGRLRDHDAAQ
jgi:hypothetical protein